MKNSEMNKIDQIARNADFVVNGYAFTCENENVRVLNLNNMDRASVLEMNGNVIATSMSDIEIDIVQKYWEKNRRFALNKC